jgi:hypothetical protein
MLLQILLRNYNFTSKSIIIYWQNYGYRTTNIIIKIDKLLILHFLEYDIIFVSMTFHWYVSVSNNSYHFRRSWIKNCWTRFISLTHRRQTTSVNQMFVVLLMVVLHKFNNKRRVHGRVVFVVELFVYVLKLYVMCYDDCSV